MIGINLKENASTDVHKSKKYGTPLTWSTILYVAPVSQDTEWPIQQLENVKNVHPQTALNVSTKQENAQPVTLDITSVTPYVPSKVPTIHSVLHSQ